MRLKDGVSLKEVSPQVLIALPIVDQLFRDAGSRVGVVVTSLWRDPASNPASLHGSGRAFDARLLSRILAEQACVPWAEEITDKDLALELAIRYELGRDFDVVLEHQAEKPPHAWHFHTEFDPFNPKASTRTLAGG